MARLNFDQTLMQFPQFYKTIQSFELPLLNKLYLIAKKLHRNYEYQCNGTDREKYEHENWKQYDAYREKCILKVDALVDKLHDDAKKLADQLDMLIYFQTDPRGLSIYLQRQGSPYIMRDNNYNTTADICF